MNTQEIKNFYDINGFYIAEKLIKQELLDSYDEYWKNKVEKGLVESGVDNHGYSIKTSRTSYLTEKEVMDILCGESVSNLFMDIDKGVALHMNLDYENSTEKDWHQDTVLPQKIVGDNYVSIWIAMEDIHPDSGPLQLVPGSHLWELDIQDIYPTHTTYATADSSVKLDQEIKKRNAEIITFLPKRGDALVWHGRLIHRGSIPVNKNISRRSLIGHYCNQWANHTQTVDCAPAINEIFSDMQVNPNYAQCGNSGWYYTNPEGLV